MRRVLTSLAVGLVLGCAGVGVYGQGANQSSGPMTNEDVIRMVRAGVPEGAINASIERSTPRFDLSAQGLAALKSAGVAEAIVLEMLRAQWAASAGTPGAAGASTSTLAGRGLAPGQKSQRLTPQQVATMTSKVHNAKGTLSPVTTNPAGQSKMETLAILSQQKQTALTERNQTSPSTGQPQTQTAGSRIGVASAPKTAATVPPASAGSSSPNRAAVMGNTNVTLACANFSSPIIQTVSGQQGSAVFTQDVAYNPFTIRGCNFGTVKGQAQLNTSAGRKLATLTVDSWTDSLITLEVDPTLTDALDQDNVTLVLFPASGPQAQKSGLRFYAKRGEMLLTSIPASVVSLAPINDDSGSPVTAKFSSPYPLSTGSMSGGVDRYNIVRFPGGTDVIDFSKLKPGFTIEKWQVSELSVAQCGSLGPTTTTGYTDGNWAWQMAGNTIRVTWQEAHCHDAYFGDNSDASYGLNVWVVGPVLSSGASPWQDGVK